MKRLCITADCGRPRYKVPFLVQQGGTSATTLTPPSPPIQMGSGISQLETLKTFTTPSQPWLLHDGDSDTELTAATAYI